MGNKQEEVKMLDLKEERQYEQLRKLGQELHIPIPEAFWELEVFDKKGKLIQRHKQRSHSWTRNAYNLLFCQLAGPDTRDSTFGAGLMSIKDTGGTIRYGAWPATLGFVRNSGEFKYSQDGLLAGYRTYAGVDTSGIQVGSGTNAESFEDYVLQTQIADGTADGQLNHIESEAHSVAYADTTLTNTLIRYFNNNSGGDISVNEVGLVTKGCLEALSSGLNWLMARDKLATTVTVPNTGQLKVTYTIQLTYPA